MVKILFTADLHGNKDQYNLLLKESYKYDIVIIGGDLTPKDPDNRTIEKQNQFIKEFLNPFLAKFKTPTILLMGNDDFKYNEGIILKNDFIYYSSNGIITINNLNFVCYSYVPLTPFKFKDWEKIEFDGELEMHKKRDFIDEGLVSSSGKLVLQKVNLETTDSIYNDLQSKITSNSIVLSHAPPYETFADTIQNEKHVGSQAIRKIIEDKQPLLSLHGHIHESVDVTGKYIDIIGRTKVCSPGNYHTTSYLYALDISIEESIEIKRIKIEKDIIVL